MNLHRETIEWLAEMILFDYYKTMNFPFQEVNIQDLAVNHMKLSVRYDKLYHEKNKYIGAIGYQKAIIDVNPDNPNDALYIDRNTVILDHSLSTNSQRPRRNFTLAHECGHQAIFMYEQLMVERSVDIESLNRDVAMRKLYSKEDWCEWQANVFAAALLMPRQLIEKYMILTGQRERYVAYDCNTFLNSEKNKIRNMATFFEVSFQAMVIRLKQLDLIEHHSYEEYIEKYHFERIREGLNYHGTLPIGFRVSCKN